MPIDKSVICWNITQAWKTRNIAICSNIDVPRNYHTKWGQLDKDKYHVISLICGILKKMIKMTLFTKQK